MQGTKKADNNADGDGSTELAEHIAGGHLLDLADKPATTHLSDLFSDDIAANIAEWHRITLDHGKHFPGPDGKPDLDPYVADLLAIPVTGVIAEALADLGVTPPTRAQCREWAAADRADGGNGTDPEVELDRVRLTVDQDVYAATTGSDEKRINGVPESIYAALDPEAQRKVLAGLVIAAPQCPTFVARWLVRHRYTRRVAVPGKKRQRRAWARTLVRVDQVWYSWQRDRWVAHTDPEWMRARLREILGGYWYLKGRTKDGVTVYDALKSWNPDTRTLAMVEDALADLVNVGSGTAARELRDAYGWRVDAYPETGTWALCRNGVLDVTTGQLRRNTPLWFSLTRIDADYDHAADPHADGDWLRVLWAQWGDDPGAITCLQQWFGYVLSGRTDLQKWMLIVGPSGSGKSIIADVLGSLMGVVVATKLDELNSHFGMQALYETGAQLAVLGDIRFSARDSSTAVENLLTVVGEDTVSVARKYKTAVSAKLGVRFHGSANEIPRFTDNAAALQKRALILETARGYRGTDEDDPGIKKRILADELGRVLRWAVEGLALLNAAGGKFTTSKRSDELANDLAELSSPVRTFVGECCEIGAGDEYVDDAALFRVWGKWATENKSGERMSKAAFRRALKALDVKALDGGEIKPSQRNNGQRVVWGIRRAATTYTGKDRFGLELVRVTSTDPEGDPMTGTA
nr:phage/plasmid primase, P4 family [Mycobacterium sp. UM_NZ2]